MEKVKGHRYLFTRKGRFYFKRGVPADARHAFDGKAQVWIALRTSDLRVARSRLQPQIEDFETKLADVRGEVAPAKIAFAPYLPSKAELEVRVRAEFEDRNKNVQSINRSDHSAVAAAKSRLEDLKAFRQSTQFSRTLDGGEPPTHVVWQAEALCAKHGWSLSSYDDTWFDLIDLVARAQIESAERELQMLEGNPPRAIDQGFSAEALADDRRRLKSGELQVGPPLALMDLFLDYVAERKPAPATVKSFKAKVEAFERFLGHGDARRVTKQDVLRWKKFLLSEGGSGGRPLHPKTVRATYLSAIKVTLDRGLESEQLKTNVAHGVGVSGVKRSPQLRSKGFTDAEAERILKSACLIPASGLSSDRKLAIRWVPWVCAYTGARVNEITQLRSKDIAEVEGYWTIRITPEAGSTKTGDARLIALHPHLIELGFQNLASTSEGPIFYDPSRRRGGSDQNPQYKKVGEFLARWVREVVGITDLGVAPNHGWRHRFKTIARECDMRYETREYIQGHSLGTDGGEYGDTSPKVTFREISKMPRYDLI